MLVPELSKDFTKQMALLYYMTLRITFPPKKENNRRPLVAGTVNALIDRWEPCLAANEFDSQWKKTTYQTVYFPPKPIRRKTKDLLQSI